MVNDGFCGILKLPLVVMEVSIVMGVALCQETLIWRISFNLGCTWIIIMGIISMGIINMGYSMGL